MTSQPVRKEPKSIHSATPFEKGIMLVAGSGKGVLFLNYALSGIFQHSFNALIWSYKTQLWEQQNSNPVNFLYKLDKFSTPRLQKSGIHSRKQKGSKFRLSSKSLV